MHIRLIKLTTALVILVLYPSTAYAATPNTLSEGSLAISPFLIDAVVKPGESQTQSITVSNVTNAPLPIALSINDFVPSGEHGSVRFLESNEQSNPTFSLASWITITTQPEFTIPPKGETKVEFTITVPAEAEPGTHYGGLLFSARGTEAPITGTTIIRKLGALVLVATGKTKLSGKIEQFNTSKSFYTSPNLAFASVFNNTGNVHLAPKGQIAIRNVFGRVIGESYPNKDGQFVLPHTARGFASTFSRSWLFGRYSAELTYSFGNPRLEAKAVAHFWVFPLVPLATGLAILLLLFVIILGYNRWIRQRANKHRP